MQQRQKHRMFLLFSEKKKNQFRGSWEILSSGDTYLSVSLLGFQLCCQGMGEDNPGKKIAGIELDSLAFTIYY